jgi:hypothetical protein
MIPYRYDRLSSSRQVQILQCCRLIGILHLIDGSPSRKRLPRSGKPSWHLTLSSPRRGPSSAGVESGMSFVDLDHYASKSQRLQPKTRRWYLLATPRLLTPHQYHYLLSCHVGRPWKFARCCRGNRCPYPWYYSGIAPHVTRSILELAGITYAEIKRRSNRISMHISS